MVFTIGMQDVTNFQQERLWLLFLDSNNINWGKNGKHLHNTGIFTFYVGRSFWRIITTSFKILTTHLAGCLKTLPTNGPFKCNIFFFSKVANIKSKSATIAFFCFPPIFLFAHSFSPFLFLQFVSVIFGAYRARESYLLTSFH